MLGDVPRIARSLRAGDLDELWLERRLLERALMSRLVLGHLASSSRSRRLAGAA